MRASGLALLAVAVALGAGCDLGLSESDIRSGKDAGTGAAGAGGVGGQGGTSTATGAGGQGAAAAANCWDEPLTEWAVAPIDKSELTGVSPGHVSISPDGLSATYDAGPPTFRRPYLVVRAKRTDSFAGGNLMATWPLISGNTLRPVLSNAATELYVDHEGDIRRSILLVGGGGMGGGGVTGGAAGTGGAGGAGAGSAWGSPSRVLPLSDVADEGFPSLTEDGLRMVFRRQLMAGVPALVEGLRTAVTDDFVEQPVVVPNLVVGDAGQCPVLSPDGLVLFFASNFGETSTMTNGNTKWKVLATKRSSLDGNWGDAVEIAVLDDDVLAVCPSGVTDDGCELTYFHYDADAATTGGEWLASRESSAP